MAKNKRNPETEYIDGEVINDASARQLEAFRDRLPALRAIVRQWAETSTADGKRKADLLRDKLQALTGNGVTSSPNRKAPPLGFFAYTGKGLAVTAGDVQAWRDYLKAAGLSASSVYARVSRVSAFYSWLIANGRATTNPVAEARPKAPKPYQNRKAQALADNDVKALLDHVKQLADGGQLQALRDYALLLMYFNTGKRRAELINLRGGDMRVNGVLRIITRQKGGNYLTTRIKKPETLAALRAYLAATGRTLEGLKPGEAVWLRHDTGGKGQALTSHGFVKQFKRYAKAAGLGDVHLHQTRHTVALKLKQEYGDIGPAQTTLGHTDPRTTLIYTGRLEEQTDYVSDVMGDWVG